MPETMPACFNSKTGELRDQGDSFAVYPGDETFIAHVANTYGDDSGDLVVVETEEPWKKKLVDGSAVDDPVKIAAVQAQQDAADTAALRMAELQAKCADGTATEADRNEALAELLS